MSEPKPKPFEISKWAVWEAYRRVKANKGGAGVDGESMAEFEQDLHGNLYKLWNRLSSGSYFPPPVRAVQIPKRDGSSRTLGVPTVADRIAQTVVRGYLEPDVELVFHEDSYGYRPGRSAHQALRVCRERCWRQDWVLDLDLKSFFDSVSWDLTLKAVAHHTDLRWVLLYIERWLRAPLRLEDGSLVERDCGTPQGSAISPLLANMMLHYAFDAWMARNHPGCPFERYADDGVVHCVSKRQVEDVLAAIAARMNEVGLRLHPDKTRIVYCEDGRRRASTSTPPSPSSGTRSGHGERAAPKAAERSPGSCPRSAPRRRRPKASSSAGRGSIGAPTCRRMTWRGGRTPSCPGGGVDCGAPCQPCG